MVSSKNRACQVIKASIALFTPVALPMTLSIIVAVADNCVTITFDATHTIRPAMLAYQLKALRIIDQRG
jgi:hypothetical protein